MSDVIFEDVVALALQLSHSRHSIHPASHMRCCFML
jgi:hypothetical protein